MSTLKLRPLSVVHVLGSFDPGGVELWLMQLNEFSKKAKDSIVSFEFICLAGSAGHYQSRILSVGSRIHVLDLRGAPLKAVWSIYNIFRAQQFDAVHSHVHWFSGLVVALAKMAGVSVRVVHSHTTEKCSEARLARIIYRKIMSLLIWGLSTNIIAVSREARGSFVKRNIRGASRVLYCGIQFDRFNTRDLRSQMRDRLGIPDGVVVYGHVGRLTRAKNHLFLFEIFKEIQKRNSDTALLLVGDGEERDSLIGFTKDTGLKGVIFAGRQSEAAPWYSAIDVFVFPSLWEGLPLSVIEAQLSGVPCLCSKEVTEEVSLADGCVEFLPVSLGAAHWANRAVELSRKPRTPFAAASSAKRAPLFSLETCFTSLRAIYGRDL